MVSASSMAATALRATAAHLRWQRAGGATAALLGSAGVIAELPVPTPASLETRRCLDGANVRPAIQVSARTKPAATTPAKWVRR